jgi:hypothetical protein
LAKQASYRGRPLNSKAAHDGKTRSIDDGEVLFAVNDSHIPSRLKVRQTNGFDSSDPISQSFTEPFRHLSVKW